MGAFLADFRSRPLRRAPCPTLLRVIASHPPLAAAGQGVNRPHPPGGGRHGWQGNNWLLDPGPSRPFPLPPPSPPRRCSALLAAPGRKAWRLLSPQPFLFLLRKGDSCGETGLTRNCAVPLGNISPLTPTPWSPFDIKVGLSGSFRCHGDPFIYFLHPLPPIAPHLQRKKPLGRSSWV